MHQCRRARKIPPGAISPVVVLRDPGRAERFSFSSNAVSRDLDIRASPIPVDIVYGGPARTRTASVGCTQGCSAGWQTACTDLEE